MNAGDKKTERKISSKEVHAGSNRPRNVGKGEDTSICWIEVHIRLVNK